MRDIKINKTQNNIVKTNKIIERKATTPTLFKSSGRVDMKLSNNTKSVFSTILFAFTTMSIFCYIFLVSSSVYFAVKESQYAYKSENLDNIALVDMGIEELKMNTNSQRISYINKKADTAISMK